MNSSIILRISHIQGLPNQQDAAITLQRDALLDHEAFEAFLSAEQFAWLSNARCTIRCRNMGLSHAWWLQHGSHHYTCSINDQVIPCSHDVQLHVGDHIEIGMMRIEVMDMAETTAALSASPVIPLLPSLKQEATLQPDIILMPHDDNEGDVMMTNNILPTDALDDIPLLTDIIGQDLTPQHPVLPNQAIIPMSDNIINVSEEASISLEQIQYELMNKHSDTLSIVSSDEDAIFTALVVDNQAIDDLPHQETHTAQPHQQIIINDTTFMAEGFQDDICHELSLEETLMGPLSINQALAQLTTDDENTLSAIALFDDGDNEMPDSEILQLFSTESVTSRRPLKTPQTHQFYPDSFCELDRHTQSFDITDILPPGKES